MKNYITVLALLCLVTAVVSATQGLKNNHQLRHQDNNSKYFSNKRDNSSYEGSFSWGLYKPQLIHSISQANNNPITISQAYFDDSSMNSTLRLLFPDRQDDSIIYNYKANSGTHGLAIQEVFDPLLGNVQFVQNFVKISSTDWIDTTKKIIKKRYDGEQKLHAKWHDLKIGYVYSIAFESFEEYSDDETILNRCFEVVPSTAVNKVLIKSCDNQHRFVIEGVNIQGEISYLGLNLPQSDNWQIKDILLNTFNQTTNNQKSFNFNNTIAQNSTLVFIKLAVKMDEQSAIQVRYSPVRKLDNFIDDTHIVDVLYQGFLNDFDKAFKYTQNNTSQAQSNYQCAVQSLSNLLGGVQYSYGDLKCVQENEDTCTDYLPLFSTTPSRLGFPRPFLWDDGFHQMLTCQYDVEFCKQDILKWFKTESFPEGWIPREQPRGAEVQSFITWLREDNRDGNPPSFLYNLLYLKSLNETSHDEFIEELVPYLDAWFNWWIDIQEVDDYQMNGINLLSSEQRILKEQQENDRVLLFKWWGPKPATNLGSGMDDWPRSEEFLGLNYISKYNIDASAWAYFFSQSLSTLTGNSTYQDLAKQIKDSINLVLLNREDMIYYDMLYNTTTSNDNRNATIYALSTHLGYPNFLPLIVGLVDSKQVLEQQIQSLMNNATLWTNQGIRSLSKEDIDFGTGYNYWRGPIWINMQYLLLRSMKMIYWDQSPLVQTFYEKLRENVITTVCGQFEERGYFFEHFNQNGDGQGAGNHPFNGWTSLITLIITEAYV